MLYSTIWWDDDKCPEVNIIDRRKLGYFGVLKEVLKLNKGDKILLNGALSFTYFWFDMWLSLILKYKGGITVLISDATWNPRTVKSESRSKFLFSILVYFQKTLFKLCYSKDTHFCFLSKDEIKIVAFEAKVNETNLHFTPFCHQLHRVPKVMRDENTSSIFRVFSGGNSLRDYDTLVLAAAKMPEIKFKIASSNKIEQPIPENVEVKYLDSTSYFKAMANADLIITPIHYVEGRSVGQQTYLNALALGIPTIVSDVVGVRDYLEHKIDAFIVAPGDDSAIVEALHYFTDKQNMGEIDEQVANGLEKIKLFTLDKYIKNLVALLKEI